MTWPTFLSTPLASTPMGKAARNRRKRAEAEEAARALPVDAQEATELIFDCDTAEAFEGLVANRPGILSSEIETQLAAMGALEGFEPTSKALAKLVRDARDHPRELGTGFGPP